MTPTLQPQYAIDELPNIAELIDDALAHAEKHLRLFEEAREHGTLDWAILDSLVATFAQVAYSHAALGKQISRWLDGPLTDAQEQEVLRVDGARIRTWALAQRIATLARSERDAMA